MRLILEGVDGSGKSSILEAIAKTHRVTSTHLGKPPKSVTPLQWADYFRAAYDQFELISRCHVSEQVYGTLIRGRSLIDDWQAWHLEQQLRVRNFKIAYVTSAYAAQRIRDRGAPSDYDLWVLDHMQDMEASYLRFLPRPLTAIIHNDGELQAAVNQAVVWGVPIMETTHVELKGIGSLTPKVVLVGDELTRRRWGFPYAKPFDFGAAARLLFEALRRVEDFYLTNSQFPDLGPIGSQFQLIRELKRFAGIRLIALGAEAATRCRRAGFEPHAIVPHPQYWRRFRYADQAAYVRDLQSVVVR